MRRYRERAYGDVDEERVLDMVELVDRFNHDIQSAATRERWVEIRSSAVAMQNALSRLIKAID